MPLPSPPTVLLPLFERSNFHLHPASSTTSAPFHPDIASHIANASYHPLTESILHLLNGHLEPAHFLLRKMDEDTGAMWTHAILHKMEGDYSNTRAWYPKVGEKLLGFWGKNEDGKQDGSKKQKEEQAVLKAKKHTDRIAKLDRKPAKETVEGGGGYTLQEYEALEMPDLQTEQNTVFDELMYLLELSTAANRGWAAMDGSAAYSSDGSRLKNEQQANGAAWPMCKP
jgi:hypothetical protein